MSYDQVTGALVPYTLTVPMVMALSDGQFFLEHGIALLRPIAMEPYCRHCLAQGLVPSVAITTSPEEFVFRCAHTWGWVKRNKPLDLQPLLAALGWDLRCTKCHQLVEANNARTDSHFLVTCPCAIRTMVNPLATTVAPPPSRPAVA